tara:strand:- start:223 stop:345 length:123 start_codon:yes stop_codon:yes gene_type:complete
MTSPMNITGGNLVLNIEAPEVEYRAAMALVDWTYIKGYQT